jgi:hypothetical protein
MKKIVFLTSLVLSAFAVFSQTPVKVDKSIKTTSIKTGAIKVTPPIIETTIQLEDINEWLCPNRLVRGDREFDGNGPVVKSEVKLRIGGNGTELWADITFNAKETKHDWSETDGRWSKKVYDVPYGKKITQILTDKASRTKFISPKAGFQLLVPGSDLASVLHTFLDKEPISSSVFAAHGIRNSNKEQFSRLITGALNNGNTVVRMPAVEGALVKFFYIVGDTGGEDISTDNNCNDDTRIVKIEFFPVRVNLETTGN